MDEDQLEERLDEDYALRNNQYYPCTICKQKLVWAAGGFDTCENCLSKQ
jgi:hypothetical protein